MKMNITIIKSPQKLHQIQGVQQKPVINMQGSKKY